jgi:hypothetical protein
MVMTKRRLGLNLQSIIIIIIIICHSEFECSKEHRSGVSVGTPCSISQYSVHKVPVPFVEMKSRVTFFLQVTTGNDRSATTN